MTQPFVTVYFTRHELAAVVAILDAYALAVLETARHPSTGMAMAEQCRGAASAATSLSDRCVRALE
ncbi:MAG: hypothetical protein F4237_11300 [Gemmatimonadetes bacterium]|nr:hypothetical protein [Gemmatimonadota bacterium]